ncbi:Lipoprotein signal peptidase [Planctomycetes bacterium Pla163]|uniref:Lipoprotein signal peptidase n=1 Tax=Rohdeia mirabilis TaxID=2528008 RepID=A0A518D0Y3_9BACT|nr:Lipoprotein signal peptidase [Planctomycetes bacterium Pla163]
MTKSSTLDDAGSPASSATASLPSPDLGRPVRRLRWRRLAWVVVLVALDLWSKAYMFEWLDRGPGDAPPSGVEVWALNGHWRVEVVGDFLGFMLSENRGAAWGFGASVPWLLVGGRVVAAVVLTVMVVRTDRRQRMLLWALVLVLSGALGNLFDNLARTPPPDHPFGAVRDFIHVYFAHWDYHFPTFNVADSCITVGAALLILSSFLAPAHGADDGEEERAEGSAESAEPSRRAAGGAGSDVGATSAAGR